MIELSALPTIREPSDHDRFLAEAMAPHVEPVPLNVARAEYLAAKMQPDADLTWFLARLIRAGYIADATIAARQNTVPKDFRAGPPERMGGYNRLGEPDNARIMGLNPRVFAETCQTIRDEKIRSVRSTVGRKVREVCRLETVRLDRARSESARALVKQWAKREILRLNNQAQSEISAIKREYNSVDITR